MSIIPVKCPFCGQDLKVELSTFTTVCTNCKREFETEKGSKYYKSIKKLNTENKKVAKAEQYAKVDGILAQADFYLKEQDYKTAEKLYDEALALSTVDYRIYLGLVYCKTKTFTDLEDVEHFKYLNLAIEYASEEAKEYVRKLYAPYHTKRSIPKEEREEFLKQEESNRYKKVENLLKDSIPKHFEREKRLKPILTGFFLSLIVTVTLIILGLSLTIDALTISSSAFAILSVLLLSFYYTNKSKTAIFNAVLDLFDGFKALELPFEHGVEFLKELNVLAVCVINNDSELALKKHLLNLLNIALIGNSEKSQAYFNSCKSISDFINKNLEKS